MIKKLSVILWIFILTGCTKGVDFETIQNYYKQSTAYSGTYKYEVDFGGVFEYICDFTYGIDGATLKIIEPQELMGITATLKQDDLVLSYDDISIETYLPENKDFTAVSALYDLIEDIKCLEPNSFVSGDTLELNYIDGDFIKKVVLSKDSFQILSCEFYCKADRILNITLQ